MALQLNEQDVPYKEFYGRNIGQMPKLIAEGRVPLSVSGLMQRRLEVTDKKNFLMKLEVLGMIIILIQAMLLHIILMAG